jgi:MoxR-like ATPase
MEALRLPAEQAQADELSRLAAADTRKKPARWLLSPHAVVDFVCGTQLADGFVVLPKFIGPRRIIEVAVATLVTDRALLLVGLPGTAKTYVAEHIAAAISGNSTRLVQGTSGTQEDAIRYGWNYARLIAEGPSELALVKSPVFQAMEAGQIARIEELTRLSADVQDALISILSEKMLPIPELNQNLLATPGFNIIATANDRDRGVHDMSSALRRRFNTVVLPLPATLQEEVDIVEMRVRQLNTAAAIPVAAAPIDEIKRLVTIFRELRSGSTADNTAKVKSPGSTLSTAEAIASVHQASVLAHHFGRGIVSAEDLAVAMSDTVVKDQHRDQPIWQEYLETVVKRRSDWADLYKACKKESKQ